MATISELQSQITLLNKQIEDLKAENEMLNRHHLQHDFGFMAPYPGSPGNPTPSDIQYGFMQDQHTCVETQPSFIHTPRDLRYGFMDMRQTRVETQPSFVHNPRDLRYGFMAYPHLIHKPPDIMSPDYGLGARTNMRYGFMTHDYITKRFFT